MVGIRPFSAVAVMVAVMVGVMVVVVDGWGYNDNWRDVVLDAGRGLNGRADIVEILTKTNSERRFGGGGKLRDDPYEGRDW